MVTRVYCNVIIVGIGQGCAVGGDVLVVIEMAEEGHGVLHLQDDSGLLHHSVGLRIVVNPDAQTHTHTVSVYNHISLEQRVGPDVSPPGISPGVERPGVTSDLWKVSLSRAIRRLTHRMEDAARNAPHSTGVMTASTVTMAANSRHGLHTGN